MPRFPGLRAHFDDLGVECFEDGKMCRLLALPHVQDTAALRAFSAALRLSMPNLSPAANLAAKTNIRGVGDMQYCHGTYLMQGFKGS